MGTCVSSPNAETVYGNQPLHLCTLQNTPKWTLADRECYTKILKVVDGDTVDLAIALDSENKFFQFRVRLWGIDTPEKRPLKTSSNRDEEIAAAKQSTAALTDYVTKLNFVVFARFREADKYGRWLCELFDHQGGSSINQWMIDHGYAVPYFGGTKQKFDSNL
jgi:endonuclease YncB( thermonuclease family)